MKKKHLLPLLITPFLFMANSPAPYQPPQEYEDFEIVSIQYGPSSESEKPPYKYEIDLQNYGGKYLLLDHFSTAYDTSESIWFENLSSIYPEQVLAPGEGGIFSGYCDDDYSGQDIKFQAYAVEVESSVGFSEVTFNSETKSESNSYQGYSRYYFDVKGVKLDNDYHYTSIIDTTINGERITYYSYSSPEKQIDFMYKSDTNPSSIVINNIYAVKGRKIDRTFSYIFYGILAVLGIGGAAGVAIAIAIGGIALFTIFIVVPGVILLAVKPWKKRKKEEKEAG